jgi:uncharacterized membrane protein
MFKEFINIFIDIPYVQEVIHNQQLSMIRSLLPVYLIILQITFSPVTTFASDYSLPEIRIEVEITRPGNIHISEHRTYHFNGSFSWADYRLPKDGFSEIRNIRVYENEVAYINENSETPGTFSVSESDREIVTTWHYRAEDESKTFTITYELTGALSVGPSYSEFFWNYLGAGRDKRTDYLDISISLPDEVSNDSLYTWSRGFEAVLSIDQKPGKIDISAEMVPQSQSVQIRTLFPTSVLDLSIVSMNTPELTIDNIILEEEAYVLERQQQRERDEFYASITPISYTIDLPDQFCSFYSILSSIWKKTLRAFGFFP